MFVITGANGQLGVAVTEQARQHGIRVYPASRQELNITDRDSVKRFFAAGRNCEGIINCAAWTAVDAAQDNPSAAFCANTYGPWLLGQLGIPVLHISTDYVFPGDAPRPRREDDSTGPKSVYGCSKLCGEQALAASKSRGAILRTAWLYSVRPGTKNFFHTILRLAKQKKELHVVNDQVGCPTTAEDLAAMIFTVIAAGGHEKEMEIFHCVNSGSTSWYGFARRILSEAGSDCPVLPIATDQYPTAAPRPAFSVLDNQKFQKRFGYSIRSWQDALHASFLQFSEY